jgi:hypothetical protein
MRVRFTQDYDYKPVAQVTVAYLAGMVKTVKRECGRRAIEAGKAVEITRQKEENDGNQVSDRPGA